MAKLESRLSKLENALGDKVVPDTRTEEEIRRDIARGCDEMEAIITADDFEPRSNGDLSPREQEQREHFLNTLDPVSGCTPDPLIERVRSLMKRSVLTE